jgi:hypothetical protein
VIASGDRYREPLPEVFAMRSPIASALFAVLIAPGSALAEGSEPIGATLSVVNVVTAAYNRDTRTLATGDDVRQNELIDVSKDASTELKLNDDTKLALGPGAKLMLDKFVYDPDKATGDIGVGLVEGAFRFMTGVAKKPTYVVKVPRASITVRGTIFDVFVQPDDTSWLLLHEGAVTVCNERGRCRDLDQPGKLIRITGEGDVGEPAHWARLDGKGDLPFDEAFPFVVKPPTIDPTPVFTREGLIKLGAIEQNAKPPHQTKTPKPERAEETKPTKKKPVKTAMPKKAKKSKTAKADQGASGALGLAVGIGLGIGLGKIGGGGGGKRMPSPNKYTPR